MTIYCSIPFDPCWPHSTTILPTIPHRFTPGVWYATIVLIHSFLRSMISPFYSGVSLPTFHLPFCSFLGLSTGFYHLISWNIYSDTFYFVLQILHFYLFVLIPDFRSFWWFNAFIHSTTFIPWFPPTTFVDDYILFCWHSSIPHSFYCSYLPFCRFGIVRAIHYTSISFLPLPVYCYSPFLIFGVWPFRLYRFLHSDSFIFLHFACWDHLLTLSTPHSIYHRFYHHTCHFHH